MGEGKIFTTLDLKSGFHQIDLLERDREKTAFAVKNGKFEFCRLPFGLKNAPSIFQRTIDDILRNEIGKTCHVYIDDIIIFSQTEEQHLKNIEKILEKLFLASMRVSCEKSKFFQDSVEFLEFTVTKNGISTCPDKVKDIVNFETPTSLRGLRAFLGLAGYYRRFVRDYARITKPLTKFLRGENGQVNSNKSKNVKITLDEEAIKAFKKIKSILASEDVLLLHPDFNKPFELTTDASSTAIGAVLSQNNRPISMISRTLTPTEENYATNEREMLAIVWSLQKLRNYLYGAKNINIFTDHQPLSFSVSEKNPNPKIRRWRAFIEEFSPKFFYKPGKENVVADALSRQYMNHMQEHSRSVSVSNAAKNGSETDSASEGTIRTRTASEGLSTVHSEESLTEVIRTVKNPVNCFKNQIIVNKNVSQGVTTETIFRDRKRHLVDFEETAQIPRLIGEVVSPDVVNCIQCDLSILASIQNDINKLFPAVKFVHSDRIVIDIENEDDQSEIMLNEHNRAHRNAQENYNQILECYFFPRLKQRLKEIVKTCKICSESKYCRRPRKTEIGRTPIPGNVGEILHIDIFSTANSSFITCLDKFSKFALAIPIDSKSIVDVKTPLLSIMNFFPKIKTIVCDNEKSFNSHTIKTMFSNFGVEIFAIPPAHSSSNGQVERLHSTLSEISRCLKAEKGYTDTKELILVAVKKYNDTIHSTTEMRPSDILHEIPDKLRENIKRRISTVQKQELKYHNRNRATKFYQPGEVVFVKANKRLGNKFSKRYFQKTIEKDLGHSVQIDNRIIHKDNIR